MEYPRGDCSTADHGCVRLFGRRSKSVDAGLVYRVYARSGCYTTAPLQLQLPLLALYMCYSFTFNVMQIFSLALTWAAMLCVLCLV